MCSLGDKIPLLVQQMKQEGASEKEIREAILDKKDRSVEKYGNKSKIGLFLEQENQRLMRDSIKNEKDVRRQKTRVTSEFNRTQIFKKELNLLKDQITERNSSLKNKLEPIQTGSEWYTTNQEFFQPLKINDMKNYRKNFKKRTPFTQWSNAYFGNGVFFNPPVTGI